MTIIDLFHGQWDSFPCFMTGSWTLTVVHQSEFRIQNSIPDRTQK